MCVVGLYFVFLLLEDVIVGYYSTDAASQDSDVNIKAAYDIFRKDMAKSVDKDSLIKSNKKQTLHFNFLNISVTPIPHKKWQIERVTQKQYEIINMLWRKTKIFVNEEDITTNPTQPDNTSKITLKIFPVDSLTKFSTSLQTTTPSKIEFYYMDDTHDIANAEICKEPKCRQNTEKNINSNNAKVTSNPSFLVFHLKGPYAEPQSVKWNTLHSNNSQIVNEQVKISRIRLTTPQRVTHQVNFKQNSFKKERKNNIIDKSTNHLYPSKSIIFNNITLAQKMTSKLTSKKISYHHEPELTTIYDKIKFFEIYDQYTRALKITTKVDYNDENKNHDDQKILLEHIDQGTYDHKQAKHSKKHIIEHFQSLNKSYGLNNNSENTKSKAHMMNITLKRESNDTSHIFNRNVTKSLPNEYKSVFSYYMNENASWHEYPFAAVYVYESSQVHCDAAGITAHWLVASGSCLSRVSKRADGEGRSAFVAYCGEQWWEPERMAYVKYSVIHPWYHPRDKTRRHLYNIGVIQVVTSMRSACAGWQPVSLMSHQFAAEPEGSWAFAVGWGLDRFDTKYGATDLPKIPLMIYKGIVYFDSCPGNIRYSKAKRLDEGGGVRNVHCLSLPPYSGEETDPVHGGLLLVGGKLIALYLQEERRPWGEQSAQYTGIWRLIPWIMDVAKEPDEMDNFMFEI